MNPSNDVPTRTVVHVGVAGEIGGAERLVVDLARNSTPSGARHALAESSALLDAVLPHLLAGLPATASDALDALRQRAFVLAKQSRAAESYFALRQAIDLSARQFGPQHEDTIWLLGSLANTYGRFGERRLELEAASEETCTY